MVNIKAIRAAIEAGASDEELAEGLEAAEFSAAAYGQEDEQLGDVSGPAYLHCDQTYSRNDAGEWLAFM